MCTHAVRSSRERVIVMSVDSEAPARPRRVLDQSRKEQRSGANKKERDIFLFQTLLSARRALSSLDSFFGGLRVCSPPQRRR